MRAHRLPPKPPLVQQRPTDTDRNDRTNKSRKSPALKAVGIRDSTLLGQAFRFSAVVRRDKLLHKCLYAWIMFLPLVDPQQAHCVYDRFCLDESYYANNSSRVNVHMLEQNNISSCSLARHWQDNLREFVPNSTHSNYSNSLFPLFGRDAPGSSGNLGPALAPGMVWVSFFACSRWNF